MAEGLLLLGRRKTVLHFFSLIVKRPFPILALRQRRPARTRLAQTGARDSDDEGVPGPVGSKHLVRVDVTVLLVGLGC
jgi:hypothetical protein